MSEATVAKENSLDPRVQGFLNSMYDVMIVWNASGMTTKVFPWELMKISARDYVEMSFDPEGWAKSYLEKLDNRWSVD